MTRFQRDSSALVRVSRLLMRCPGGTLNVPLTSKTSINVPLVPDYRTLIRTRAFGFGFCLSRLIINFKFLVYCLSEEIPPPPLFAFSSMTTPSSARVPCAPETSRWCLNTTRSLVQESPACHNIHYKYGIYSRCVRFT